MGLSRTPEVTCNGKYFGCHAADRKEKSKVSFPRECLLTPAGRCSTAVSARLRSLHDHLPVAPPRSVQTPFFSLQKDEVAQVVRRTSRHYLIKISNLMQEKEKLQKQVSRLQNMVLRQKEIIEMNRKLSSSSNIMREEHEKSGTSLARNSISAQQSIDFHTEEVNYLRKALQSERRQRLLVEEQSHQLAEQHATLVRTLEQRLHRYNTNSRQNSCISEPENTSPSRISLSKISKQSPALSNERVNQSPPPFFTRSPDESPHQIFDDRSSSSTPLRTTINRSESNTESSSTCAERICHLGENNDAPFTDIAVILDSITDELNRIENDQVEL